MEFGNFRGGAFEVKTPLFFFKKNQYTSLKQKVMIVTEKRSWIEKPLLKNPGYAPGKFLRLIMDPMLFETGMDSDVVILDFSSKST